MLLLCILSEDGICYSNTAVLILILLHLDNMNEIRLNFVCEKEQVCCLLLSDTQHAKMFSLSMRTQLRSRSTQSNQGLRYPLEEALDTNEYINVE